MYRLSNPSIKLRMFVCFVHHVEISRTVHPPIAHLVLSESSRQGGVHGLCFKDVTG